MVPRACVRECELKTIALNLAASEPTGVRSWQDGDIFRESNCDLPTTDIVDALGWLKTTLSFKVAPADDVDFSGTINFTGAVVFDETTGLIPVEFNTGILINALGLEVTSGGITCSAGNISLQGGELTYSSTVSSGTVHRVTTGTDAALTITAAADEYRCPQLTANRVWTVDNTPAPTTGRRLRVSRPRTADAFTLTIQREDTTTLCVFASMASGYVDLIYFGGQWVVSGHHGGSSVNTDV